MRGRGQKLVSLALANDEKARAESAKKKELERLKNMGAGPAPSSKPSASSMKGSDVQAKFDNMNGFGRLGTLNSDRPPKVFQRRSVVSKPPPAPAPAPVPAATPAGRTKQPFSAGPLTSPPTTGPTPYAAGSDAGDAFAWVDASPDSPAPPAPLPRARQTPASEIRLTPNHGGRPGAAASPLPGKRKRGTPDVDATSDDDPIEYSDAENDDVIQVIKEEGAPAKAAPPPRPQAPPPLDPKRPLPREDVLARIRNSAQRPYTKPNMVGMGGLGQYGFQPMSAAGAAGDARTDTDRLGSHAAASGSAPRPFGSYDRDRDLVAAVGMSNLGNTCFMNSVLQALLSAEPFVLDLAAEALAGVRLPHGNIRRALVECARKLWLPVVDQHRTRPGFSLAAASRGAAINPGAVKSAIEAKVARFKGTRQQDAHEFLAALLEHLEAECLAPQAATLAAQGRATGEVRVSEAACPTARNLVFTTCKRMECRGCGHVSKVFELHNHLSLEVTIRGREPEGTPLDYVLQHFSREEEVSKDCERCHAASAPHMLSCRIQTLPRVLIVHLKRFRMQASGWVNKVTTKMILPAQLQLKEYCTPTATPPTRHPALHPSAVPGKENDDPRGRPGAAPASAQASAGPTRGGGAGAADGRSASPPSAPGRMSDIAAAAVAVAVAGPQPGRRIGSPPSSPVAAREGSPLRVPVGDTWKGDVGQVGQGAPIPSWMRGEFDSPEERGGVGQLEDGNGEEEVVIEVEEEDEEEGAGAGGPGVKAEPEGEWRGSTPTPAAAAPTPEAARRRAAAFRLVPDPSPAATPGPEGEGDEEWEPGQPGQAAASASASPALPDSASLYQLSSVVCHMGDSPLGGHYVTDRAERASGRWIRCNDANVFDLRQTTEQFLKDPQRRAQAYMAVYLHQSVMSDLAARDEAMEAIGRALRNH